MRSHKTQTRSLEEMKAPNKNEKQTSIDFHKQTDNVIITKCNYIVAVSIFKQKGGKNSQEEITNTCNYSSR